MATSRSPDGRWFAAGHADGTILLVKLLPPDEPEISYLEAMTRPNAASGDKFEVRFAPVRAQHVKVAFTRTFTKAADGVFLDDIEVY